MRLLPHQLTEERPCFFLSGSGVALLHGLLNPQIAHPNWVTASRTRLARLDRSRIHPGRGLRSLRTRATLARYAVLGGRTSHPSGLRLECCQELLVRKIRAPRVHRILPDGVELASVDAELLQPSVELHVLHFTHDASHLLSQTLHGAHNDVRRVLARLAQVRIVLVLFPVVVEMRHKLVELRSFELHDVGLRLALLVGLSSGLARFKSFEELSELLDFVLRSLARLALLVDLPPGLTGVLLSLPQLLEQFAGRIKLGVLLSLGCFRRGLVVRTIVRASHLLDQLVLGRLGLVLKRSLVFGLRSLTHQGVERLRGLFARHGFVCHLTTSLWPICQEPGGASA